MSRYAASHESKNLAGPGDARPTALQIINDEGLEGKLGDKVYLVTGTSSGIGIETLRALHITGAHVIGTVRDVSKGQKVVDTILGEKRPNGGKISLVEIKLDDLASIKSGAAEVLKITNGKLNGLINNAGIMAVPEGKTKDGFETQFGTNHLGHFLLFQLLKDALLASATPDFPSRVVSVTSKGHTLGTLRFRDFHFEQEPYQEWQAYGQSKTANIWFASALERRFGGQHLHATSVHPGGILTNLSWNVPKEFFDQMLTPDMERYLKNAEQGAATQVYAAVGEEWKHKGGKYLSNCLEEVPAGSKAGISPEHDDGYAKWAYDPELEERLWEESLKMVGLPAEST